MALVTSGTSLAIGDNVSASCYASGFDHASLVTAGRSRADGYDLYVTASGVVQPSTSLTGANTSACKVAFNSTKLFADPTNDSSAFQIHFGNLGATAPSYATASIVPAGLTVTPASLPSISLPSPGFPLGRSVQMDAVENTYPAYRTPRRARQNENNGRRWSLSWSNLSPEDWYEIRAVVAGVAGVGTVTVPQIITDDGSAVGYRVIPNTLRCHQESRLKLSASLELEEVFI